jgi:uncharacterized LabA/DUF88 family protein
VSKNVAVFVDVANIFYAAKAAGVDIDYVTLLKSATAGRDLVRAYAYTGLDPDNENQRQFHSFLARSGYKVVSKDIRKYGDGRIKANLDIELVVDMMRMAEKIDIAVVVSGDGDFAPAIHAVQQQGVRVEVISFRGNTSSDLIDAADVFLDISNIARVEKGARSGRRVAAEGDLSMTEVPDKESGVAPRRRRGEERPERAERVERPPRRGQPASVPDDRQAAGLVALPGEKLSRGAGPFETPAPPLAEGEAGVAALEEIEPMAGEEGRRRRRRRGGRGRGRGARGLEGSEPQVLEPDLEAADFPDEVPTLPQHSAFGSVWDRQIGMPSERPAAPASTRREVPIDDELDAEPDVPEYLLAERRQHDRRRDGRGGRGGRPGGYRSALDRERYGVGSRSGFARGPGRGGKGGHHVTPGRASAHAMAPIDQTPGGDPWSEVPPEVQELLRAELARRQSAGASPAGPKPSAGRRTGGRSAGPATGASRPQAGTADEAGTAAHAVSDAGAAVAATGATDVKPPRTTRQRTTRRTAAGSAASAATESAADVPAEEEEPKRTTRKRAASRAAVAGSSPDDGAGSAEGAPTEEAKPKRTTRKRATKATASEEA